MELIDTHAHLDFPDFEGEVDAVVSRAREAGVARIVTVGTGVESSRRAVALAERFEEVFASVGVHPNDCMDTADDAVEHLKVLASHPKVVAVGETGLDYHYLPSKTASRIRGLAEPPLNIAAVPSEKPLETEPSDLAADVVYKSRQMMFFRQQVSLALECRKPLIIHQREGFDDVLEVLGRASAEAKRQSFLLRGVFHCFGEDLEKAQRVLAAGFNIGFTGILTFKKAAGLRNVAAQLPSDRVVIETDCPYLAPEPYRGKRCEPAYVLSTVRTLAEARRVSAEEAAVQSSRSAKNLFGL